MSLPTLILATLTALELLFICYLETLATTSGRTARVFGMEPDEMRRPVTQTLFKNQGAYNGVLGILLLLALWVWPSGMTVGYLLAGVVAVAAYGGLSVAPSIFLKQGTLPLLALLSMCL